MTLISGTRLGPYEILAPLGAGGMGEVYRARDTRLDRAVAIKILPPHLSADPTDNARLALRLVFEPVFVGDVREREHLLSASITVGATNEIKQLFLSYQAAGVSLHQTLKKEPWCART